MEIRELADALRPPTVLPGQDVQYRQGVVNAVPGTQTVPPSVTITMGGSSATVAGVRFPAWYSPTVGDVVELLKTGPSVQIVSVLSAAGVAVNATTVAGRVAPDTAWTAVTFTNGWTNYGSGYNTAAYRRDDNGFVHLKGLVSTGTIGASMFTLPVGYRPLLQALFVSISNQTIGRVDVTPSGTVLASLGSATYLSIEGITFLGEQ